MCILCLYKYYQPRIFKNAVIIPELIKSINKLPIRGNIKNAMGDGPYDRVTESITATPLGVAPRPKDFKPLYTRWYTL